MSLGLSPESLNVVVQRVSTLEILLDKTDNELRVLLNNNANVREEEVRRLVRAMVNLKRCRQSIHIGEKEPADLYWDSWDRHHHIHHRTGASPRTHRSIVNATNKHHHSQMTKPHLINTEQVHSPIEISPPESESYSMAQLPPARRQTISPEEACVSILTPSPSPPSSPSASAFISSNKQQKGFKGFPTTPPPRKKHQTMLPQPLNQQSFIQQQSTIVNQQAIINTNNPMQTSPKNSTQNLNDQQQQQQGSLTKSKSHESQLIAAAAAAAASGASTGSEMVTNPNGNNYQTTIITTHAPTPRSRLHTEPSPDNFNDITENSNNLTVPRSPCTPIGVNHHHHHHHRNSGGCIIANTNISNSNSIAGAGGGMGQIFGAHRFTKKFKVMSTCDLCNKQMFFGLKCKECKYRCHKDCESNVPPSCGFKKSMLQQSSDVFLPNNSPNIGGRIPVGGSGGGYLLTTRCRDRHRSQDYNNIQYPYGADSSSAGSSCNSSTPSSPALLTLPPHTPITTKTQFKFPEVTNIYKPVTVGGITLETHLIRQEKLVHQQQQQQQQPSSPRPQQPNPEVIIGTVLNNVLVTNASTSVISTMMGGAASQQQQQQISHDSEKTISISGASTDSDRTPMRVDSTDEPDEGDDRNDNDNGHWSRQNSVSLKEWDIPFEDINLMEKIGDGRFGTVYRAQWHGAVAIKILKEDYLDNEAFKLEVATFKKTRHENVVLFMGACIKPQAIVTSLCKGNTLYTHIHLRKDKFNLNKTTLVAQQISLGMGYLHARCITHKDLKTKNIFLENGKVIITDFGLFSATKLDYQDGHGLCIPHGWLAYLAPEIMRKLTPYPPEHRDQLPFSNKSDIYAFGTVWYELLCGDFPFQSQAPEAIIFQVGRGMKQTLANLQVARDVKEILMTCWAFDRNLRPDFSTILQQLEKLPKKRLARSPSHPVQLSRSAESVF